MEGGNGSLNNVENRVVEMKFDNAQFEQAVAKTMDTLDKFKEKLNFEESGKGLDKLSKSTDSYSGVLSSVGSALETLQDKFGSLRSIGETVFETLTSAATGFVKNGLHEAISGIMEGGMSRAKNLEQAKFQLEGILGSAEEVNRVIYNDILPELQGTPFSLDQAAVVMGQLAASGKTTSEEVQQGTRAIAGAAAMTNSSFADMGRIFTKVAGNGRVMGDTLQEMSSRGLNAAADMGKVFDMTEAEVREAVTAGEISYDMFAEAMDKLYGAQAKKSTTMYTGALEDLRAALARIGAEPMAVKLEFLRDAFNALVPAVDAVNSVFKPFTSSAKELEEYINDDGEKVTRYAKPFAGSLAKNVQSAGWAFQELFVRLDDNKDILRYNEDNWKELGLQIEKNEDGTVSYFETLADGRKVYHDFGEAVMNPDMYRIVTAAAQSFVNVIAALGNLLGAVGKGIIEAFPKLALSNIASFVEGIQRFTKAFVFTEPVLKSIQSIVRAIFTPLGMLARLLITIGKVAVSVISMTYTALKPFAKVLLSSIGLASDAFSGFGSLVDQAAQNVTWFAEKIFGGLKSIAQFLKLDVIFSRLRDTLEKFSVTIQGAGGKIYNFFNSFSTKMHSFGKTLYTLLRLDEVAEAIGRLRDRFHSLMQTTGHLGFDKLVAGIKNMVNSIKAYSSALQPIEKMRDVLKNAGKDLLAMVPTEKVVAGINTFTNHVIGLGLAISDFIAPYVEKAAYGMASFASAIANIFRRLKDAGTIQAVIQIIGELFRRLIGYIPQLMGFRTFGDMLDRIKSKVQGFVGVFTEFITALAGGGKLKAQNFGAAITNSLEGIGDTKMVKKLKGFSEVVKHLGEVLKSLGGKFGEKLKEFYKAFQDGDKNKMLAGLSLLTIAASYITSIVKLRNTFKKAADTVSFFAGIGKALSGAGEMFSGIGKTAKNMMKLIGLTTSLLILATAMSVLSRMDMEGLIQGGIAAIGALIALAITLKILDKIAVDEKGAKKVFTMGGAMAAVGAAVLMITTSMEKISGIFDSHTPKQFAVICGVLLGMMGAFALLAFEFSKLDKMEASLKSAGLSMLAISTAIKIMTNAIAVIGSEDPAVLIKGSLIVGGLMVFMGALAFLTGNNSSFDSVGSGILKVAAALLVLKVAIDLYAAIDPITFAVGLVKLGIALTALLAIFSVFGQVVGPKNGGGLILASIAILALSAALAVLSAIPFIGLITGVLGLGAALVVIGAALAILSALGVGMIVVAGAFTLLGIAFLAVGGGALLLTTALATLVPLLLLLSNIDTEMLSSGLNVIKMIADSLGSSFLSLAGGVLAFGAALLVAAVAVVVLAAGVVLLGAGFAVCGVGLLALAGGLATIALVVDAFFGGDLLKSIGNAFTTFGGTVISGLGGLIDKAKKFFSKDKGKETVQDYTNGMTETVENDTGISTAFGNKITEAQEAITSKKSEFGDAWGSLMSEGGSSIEANSSSITGPLGDLGVDVSSIVSGDVSDASSLFGKLPGKAGKAVSSNKKEFTNPMKKVFGSKDILPSKDMEKNLADSGKKAPKAYGDAISKNKNLAVKEAKKMNTEVKKPYKTSYKDFHSYGVDAGRGYKNGIRSMASEAAKEAASMVRKAKEAAKAEQDSNSPSKEFAKFGRWADEGYILGLQSLSGQVAKAAAGVVSGGIDAVSDAMSVIADASMMDMDFTPTISPVVDLENVRKGASDIDSLLGGIYGLNSPYSGFYNAQMAASAFQNNNSPESDAINKLAKELGSITDAMNSRSLNNYINITGNEDPNAFADALTRRFKLNARTM